MRFFVLMVLVFCAIPGVGEGVADSGLTPEEQAYKASFLTTWRRSLEGTADPEFFDNLFMGKELDLMLSDPNLHNDLGSIAWSFAATTMAYSEMWATTGDNRYAETAERCIDHLVKVRDDQRGVTLESGRQTVAWSATKYAKGRRVLHAVHTGTITKAILQFLYEVKQRPEYREKLGAKYAAYLEMAEAALAEHDWQWREGPVEGEGYYEAMEQEEKINGKPLPANRQSAMGWAQVYAWRVTGKDIYKERAVKLGWYFKNRLTLGEDGAYYWPFHLEREPVDKTPVDPDFLGEDVSHSSLTIQLPIVLDEEGWVFTDEDMGRFAKTVTEGFGRLGGLMLPFITGEPLDRPSLATAVARYLPLAQYNPEAGRRIAEYYVVYRRSIASYDLALLIAYHDGVRSR